MQDHSIRRGGRPTSEGLSSTALSLLERVRAHEPDAWRRLADLYSPLVYHWCRCAGLGAEDAADVLQDVFRSVAGAISSFRRDRPGDSFRGWLRVITQNQIRDNFRRRGERAAAVGGSDAQQRLMQIPDPAVGSSEDTGASDEAGLVFQRALELIRAEFEETTWQAFWRVSVEDQYPADVAADLGITTNAVYKAKSRVLHRLRHELGDLIE